MKKNHFKFILIILLVTFTLNAKAYIFVPLLFGAAEAAVDGTILAGAGEVATAYFTDAVASTLSMSSAIKNSALIHAAILSITFSGSDSSKTPAQAPITINLNPNVPLITPANWTPPTGTQSTPIPPHSSTSSPKYASAFTIDGPYFATAAAACAGLGTGGNVAETTSNIIKCRDGNGAKTADVSLFDVCPTGYLPVGDGVNCYLQSPKLVMKPSDLKCTLIKDASGGIIPDPLDPDCNSADLLAAGIDATDPKTVKITNPQKTDKHTITSKPDGSTTIEHMHTTSDNKTKYDTVSISPDGNITGSKSETYAGTGSLAGSPSSGTPAEQTITFDKTGLATVTNQQQQIALQSDSNQILTTIKDELHCKDCVPEDNSQTDKQKVDTEVKKTTDLIDKQGSDSQHDSDENLFTVAIGSVIPSGGTCQSFTKSIAGKEIVIDACPTINFISQILGWLYAVYAGFFISSLIFKGN